MSQLLVRLRSELARLWRIDARLTATGLLMLGLLVGFGAGLALDSQVIVGAPRWLKPAKFAASIGVYCLTVVWLFGFIPEQVRTRRIVGAITVAGMWLEMGIIGVQAARGTTSHFNVGTPLDATLFAVMGVGILAQTLTSVALAVALFRQRFEDDALGWATRFGMVITIVGALLGGVMTRPSPAQLAQMDAGHPSFSGAHTVGALDGGPGMTGTGWSRAHGDVRVPHFFGLHALQLLPLLALASRRLRASRARRVRLVLTLSASYVGLFGILLWQALSGQSLTSPDARTLAALSVWAALSAGLGWASVKHGESRRRVAAVAV